MIKAKARMFLRVIIIFVGVTILLFQAVAAVGSQDILVAGVDYVDQKIGELATRIAVLESGAGVSTTQIYNSGTTGGITDERSQEILDKLASLELKMTFAENVAIKASESSIFQALSLQKGQTIISLGSSEVIVRSGIASAIQGINGDGLADFTTGDGIDYYTGDIVPKNHHVIISRDDGRGLKAESEIVYLLVRGSFIINNPVYE